MAIIFNSEPIACYGAAELTVDALLNGWNGTIDWAFEACEPAWLCKPSFQLLAIVETANVGTVVLASSRGPVGWAGWLPPDLLVAVHPESGITADEVASLVSPEQVPVQVTGHFDDPAAQSCNFSGLDGTPADFVDICRKTFVVTSITLLAE